MTAERKKYIRDLLNKLDEIYPDKDRCYLNYTKDYELLFAVILSAQCTDERVNIVTESLFNKYTSIGDFAFANQAELETDIKSIGLYRVKAKNIILCAGELLSAYKGCVPSGLDELTSLAGVGRKTANIVRGALWNIPCIAVDTHVARVSGRLGIVKVTNPVKIEFALMNILPKEHWIRFNTQIIAHGRAVCKARTYKCGCCPLNRFCVVGCTAVELNLADSI